MNVFPYPGNKARHSEWILEHFPEHEVYVELFGGAAGVLFNKPRSKIEVYNDLNGDIPHFFRVLRDNCGELQEWLRNVPYSRDVYDEWADEYYAGERVGDDIERAGRFFTLRYMQFGGKIEDKAGFSRDTFNDGRVGNSYSFRNKAEALEPFRDRMCGVTIESTDEPTGFLDLINSYDRKETLFYADPPYEGTENRYNSAGFNHRKLADKAREIDGKMVISYDSIPRYYGDGFTVASKDSDFSISQGENKDATEYLIMNFDSSGEQLMSGVGQQGLDNYQ